MTGVMMIKTVVNVCVGCGTPIESTRRKIGEKQSARIICDPCWKRKDAGRQKRGGIAMDWILKYLELLVEQQKTSGTADVQERIDRMNDAIEKEFGFVQ